MPVIKSFYPDEHNFIWNEEESCWVFNSSVQQVYMKIEKNVYEVELFEIYKNGERIYYGKIPTEYFAHSLLQNLFITCLPSAFS